jgi:ABC-type bacteriocin/lantibiotic exporter with double-glycine peptidase domain
MKSKKIIMKIPFYSNTPDNTHCFQACLKMILKYFLPNRDFSWKELDKMSAKEKGLWTWPTAAILTLKKLGFDVIMIKTFDYERFIKEGKKYLLEKYGEEIAEAQVKHSNINKERRLARKLIKEGLNQKRRPATLADIKRLISKGYAVICNVNSRALNNKKGYVGHFIVVVGVQGKKIILHDPGLPPFPNRKISKIIFEKCWGYPSKDSKNIIAIKYFEKN